jgi:Raf kinase inhibitor-like YbhB/YbcL family protein
MSFTQEVTRKVGHAIGRLRAGVEKIASRKLGTEQNRTLVVTSQDFVNGEPLPPSTTKDGEGIPPIIAWSAVPEATKSIVMICEDPDAPLPEPFAHWLVYDIPPAATMLDEATRNTSREGKNSNLKVGYAPVAPPRGHGSHAYHFQVFALDMELPINPGAGRYELLETMRGHVIAWGDLIGTCDRE